MRERKQRTPCAGILLSQAGKCLIEPSRVSGNLRPERRVGRRFRDRFVGAARARAIADAVLLVIPLCPRLESLGPLEGGDVALGHALRGGLTGGEALLRGGEAL